MDDVAAHLPVREQLYWREYLDAERRGVRSDVLARLDAFVDSMDDLGPDRVRVWALEFAAASAPSGGPAPVPLRYPLWKSLVFPNLLALVEGGDPVAARLLAEHWHLVISSPGCLDQLPSGLRGRQAMLERALQGDPSDDRSRLLLIEEIAEHLAHTIHEVPSGVLWGMDGATVAQCRELEAALERFVELVSSAGTPDAFDELINRCRHHFRGYADYLTWPEEHISYAEFLAAGPTEQSP